MHFYSNTFTGASLLCVLHGHIDFCIGVDASALMVLLFVRNGDHTSFESRPLTLIHRYATESPSGFLHPRTRGCGVCLRTPNKKNKTKILCPFHVSYCFLQPL